MSLRGAKQHNGGKRSDGHRFTDNQRRKKTEGMSELKRDVVYFEHCGEANTVRTLEIARERAEAPEIGATSLPRSPARGLSLRSGP